MIEKFLLLVGFCAAVPLRSIPTITQDEPAVQTVTTFFIVLKVFTNDSSRTFMDMAQMKDL